MNTREKSFYLCVGVVLLFLLFWNLYTLQYTPIPWIDEVYFASVTHSLTEGNGLTLDIGLNEPVYHYGPVYFLLTGLFTKLGGLNIISFRLVGMLFSFLSSFMVYKIMEKRGVNKYINLSVILLLLFDQLFVYCSHMGRMEFVAIFFILSAFYFYDRYKEDKRYLSLVLSTVSMLLSVLTTSRSLIVIVPIGLAWLVTFIKQKEWIKTFVFVAIPVIGFMVWLFMSYGSVSAFIEYFSKPSEGDQQVNFFQRFIGASFDISKNHYPLVLLALLSVAHSVKYKYFKDIQLYLYTILLFYFVVHSTNDVYSILIMPFYFIIIGIGLQKAWEIGRSKNWWYKGMLALFALCWVINLGIFGVKWMLLESSKEFRDEDLVEAWIKENVPEGSDVIGSYAYYYPCMENNCNFKSLNDIRKSETQAKEYLANQFHAQYIILSTEEAIPEALMTFDYIDNKELIAHYSPVPYINWLDRLMSKIGLVNHSSYEGDLYKVIYK